MKIVAAVFADLSETGLGLPSGLGAELAGQPVLERTLRRVSRIAGLSGRYVLVRGGSCEVVARLLDGAGLADEFEIVEDTGFRRQQALIRAARKWTLESWRASPLGTTYYDEFADLATAGGLLNHAEADAVLCVDGHQAAVDVEIATAMVSHARDFAHEAPFVFTQAPPGLAGLILSARAIADLLRLDIPFGLLLSYRPEIPQADPITSAMCMHIAPSVEQFAGRLAADTHVARDILARAFAACGPEADALALCRFLAEQRLGRAARLPADVEIELTTEDPLPETTLRPRGPRVPRRHLSDLDAVRRIADELAACDDRAVALGGHGDPLQHPDFPAVCSILRRAGILSVGVVSPLVDCRDAAFDALLSGDVDLIEVQLDAHSRETYRRVHGRDAFDQVRDNIARLEAARADRKSPRPILVPSQTRCEAVLPELEHFHDHWLRAVGSAVIRPHNTFGGRLPPDTLLPTVPPCRSACRRIASRLVLLADGTAAACTQDVDGAAPVGNWHRESLASIWSGSALVQLRNRQEAGLWAELPICASCTAWNER